MIEGMSEAVYTGYLFDGKNDRGHDSLAYKIEKEFLFD